MLESIGNNDDAIYFKRKGEKTLNRDYIAPEKLPENAMQREDLIIMNQARNFLLQAINDDDVINEKPAKLANTLFFFDCWANLKQEPEQNKEQTDSITYCRESFYKNLDKLYLPNSYQAKTPIDDNIKCEKSVCISSNGKILYFPFDEDVLSSEAKYLIKQTAQKISNITRPYKITLNGYADRASNEEYNIELARKRALSIKNELIKNNIDKKLISIFAFNEMQATIKTVDGLITPENRSVQLIITTY